MTQPDFFRKEALENASQAFVGDPFVESAAPSIRAWRRFGLFGVGILVLFGILVPIPDYGTAPAILDYTESVDLVASVDGQVKHVLADAGQPIDAGQTIVQLESASLARQLNEVTGRLNTLLLDGPARGDAGARELRDAAREVSEVKSSLGRLAVSAPEKGTVAAVRVRVGESTTAGAPVATIAPDRAELEFIVFPTPLIADSIVPGAAIGLVSPSVPGQRLSAVVVRVTATVMSAAAARRSLASQISDLVVLPSAVLVVHTRLSEPSRLLLQQRRTPGVSATAYFELRRLTMFQRMALRQ